MHQPLLAVSAGVCLCGVSWQIHTPAFFGRKSDFPKQADQQRRDRISSHIDLTVFGAACPDAAKIKNVLYTKCQQLLHRAQIDIQRTSSLTAERPTQAARGIESDPVLRVQLRLIDRPRRPDRAGMPKWNLPPADEAAAAIQHVLGSSGDTCPECRPEDIRIGHVSGSRCGRPDRAFR